MFRPRRTLISLFSLLILAAIVRNAPQTNRALGAVPNELMIPLRLMWLQAQPPDEHLFMPVQGLSAPRIADTWGAPRPHTRRHEGQDIFAHKGTPVTSATEGVVIRKNSEGLGGTSVSVFGPGGRVYYYAHLDRWAETLELGETVEPGTLLGYVGNTGNARGTPPHLHFGIYTSAGTIDPLPLLLNSTVADKARKALG